VKSDNYSNVKIKLGKKEYSIKFVKRCSTFFFIVGALLILVSLFIMPIGIIFLISGLFFLFMGYGYRKTIKNAFLSPHSTISNEKAVNLYKNAEANYDIQEANEPALSKENIDELIGSCISIETIDGSEETKQNKINHQFDLSTKVKRAAFVNYVCIDVETTGLLPDADEIVEVSAVRYRNNEISDTFTTLINPKIHISSRITKINGISDDMVKDSPFIYDAMPKLIEFIGTDAIVAHNMPFDYKFLAATAEKVNLKFNPYTVDTLTLSRKAFKDIENHKLQTLAKELNIPVSQAHRSESDAIVCGYLLQKCILKLNETKPRAKATANK
jgi:DNA polymerase III epsilon subunit family exonuclease